MNWRPRTPQEQPNGRTANSKYDIPSKSQPRRANEFLRILHKAARLAPCKLDNYYKRSIELARESPLRCLASHLVNILLGATRTYTHETQPKVNLWWALEADPENRCFPGPGHAPKTKVEPIKLVHKLHVHYWNLKLTTRMSK